MRVLVTGATGQLGAYVMARLSSADHEVVALGGRTGGQLGDRAVPPFDLTDFPALSDLLNRVDPTVILHLAAVSRAEDAHRDPESADLVNVEVTRFLAAWAARRRARLVVTSTDLVFDGAKGDYREDDPAAPVLTYGRTKREGEIAALAFPGVLVARLSLLYGPGRTGKPTFFDAAMKDLREGRPRAFFADEYRTPLDYGTAADVLIQLLPRVGLDGVLHVGGPDRMSRYQLIRRCAWTEAVPPALIGSNRLADFALAEPRPADVSLDSGRLLEEFPSLRRPQIEEAIWLMGKERGT